MSYQIDTDAKIIGSRTDGFGHPGIIRTSTSRIYVGHINGSGYLEIHYSEDGGQTWDLDTTFSDDADIDMFSFALSDQDDVFVTFSYATAVDTYTVVVKKRDYSSGTWSEITSETSISCSTILKPCISWNRGVGLTRLHLFWYENTGGVTNLKNKYTDNYGSSWGSTTTYEISASEVDIYMGCIDSNPTDGNVHVLLTLTVLREYIFTSAGAHSSTVGHNWNQDASTLMVIDTLGNKWYYLIREAQDYANIAQNSTSSWTTIFNAENPKKGMMALGIDGKNNVYAFCTGADEKCYYIKYDKETASWGSETALTTGDGLRPACEIVPTVISDQLGITFYTD